MTNDLAAAIELVNEDLRGFVQQYREDRRCVSVMYSTRSFVPSIVKLLDRIDTLTRQHADEVAALKAQMALQAQAVSDSDAELDKREREVAGLRKRVAELEIQLGKQQRLMEDKCDRLEAERDAAKSVIECVKSHGLMDSSDYQQLLDEYEATHERD